MDYAFTLYPAIDLKDGAAVRLLRGEMASATVFNPDPAAQAEAFSAAGFARLHVVDLNGAFEGRSVNEDAVRAILADDFDADGHKDLILAGNFDGVPPRRGRYDASYGWLLRGDGQGAFAVVEPAESNLWIEGQTRALRRLRLAGGARLIVVARNDAPLQVLRWNTP